MKPAIGKGSSIWPGSWTEAKAQDGSPGNLGDPAHAHARASRQLGRRLNIDPGPEGTHPIAEWGRMRFGGADVPAERRLADLESSLAQVKLDPAENAALVAPLLDIPLPKERVPTLAPEELRRRQLAALTNWAMVGAKVQPAVLAVEDLHWADPTTLDVLRGIGERGALAPLFIVATTRPEFRPPLGTRSHHGTISLAPLDRGQVRDMVGELSARYAPSREVIEDVATRTGGVPLFVEEVTRLLLERGGESGIQMIPPTLQQSLMARLDRLGSARDVAHIGSVIGRGFSYGLLRAVAGMDDVLLQAALENSPTPTSCWCRAWRRLATTASSTRSFRTWLTKICSKAADRSCTGASPRLCAINLLIWLRPNRKCWRITSATPA